MTNLGKIQNQRQYFLSNALYEFIPIKCRDNLRYFIVVAIDVVCPLRMTRGRSPVSTFLLESTITVVFSFSKFVVYQVDTAGSISLVLLMADAVISLYCYIIQSSANR